MIVTTIIVHQPRRGKQVQGHLPALQYCEMMHAAGIDLTTSATVYRHYRHRLSLLYPSFLPAFLRPSIPFLPSTSYRLFFHIFPLFHILPSISFLPNSIFILPYPSFHIIPSVPSLISFHIFLPWCPSLTSFFPYVRSPPSCYLRASSIIHFFQRAFVPFFDELPEKLASISIHIHPHPSRAVLW